MTAPRSEPGGGVTAPRRSVTVGRLVVGGRPLVAKRATGGARRRLRREAELLDHLQDLPVVQLVALRDSDDHTDLVTADAGNCDLADPAGRTPDELLARPLRDRGRSRSAARRWLDPRRDLL